MLTDFNYVDKLIFKSFFGVSPRIALIFDNFSDCSNSYVVLGRIQETLFVVCSEFYTET